MQLDEKETTELFNSIPTNIPVSEKRFINHSMAIVAAIEDAIEKGELTQKDLSQRLDKNESQISSWLKGDHNFTLKIISQIEEVLGVDLIIVKQKDNPDYEHLRKEVWQEKAFEGKFWFLSDNPITTKLNNIESELSTTPVTKVG